MTSANRQTTLDQTSCSVAACKRFTNYRCNLCPKRGSPAPTTTGISTSLGTTIQYCSTIGMKANLYRCLHYIVYKEGLSARGGLRRGGSAVRRWGLQTIAISARRFRSDMHHSGQPTDQSKDNPSFRCTTMRAKRSCARTMPIASVRVEPPAVSTYVAREVQWGELSSQINAL